MNRVCNQSVNAMSRVLLLLGAAGLLAGCVGRLPVDATYEARAQDSRVRFIVLHYTSENLSDSLQLLTRSKVSAHYLVADRPPKVFRLVDESRRAWHAGASEWFGYKNLNAMSIGIEIVNAGPLDAMGQRWAGYDRRQIALLADLLRDIQSRHHVSAHNIVAHSDIAPLRKIDPGPAFPWRELAMQGLGRWYDETAVRRRQPGIAPGWLAQAGRWQAMLKQIGYPVAQTGVWDAQTRLVLRAFQMHYRPVDYRGTADRETFAIIENLANSAPAEP